MSNDNGVMVEMLQGVWSEIKTVNSRTARLEQRLEQGFAEIRGDIVEMRGDIVMLGRRIDNLLLGEHGREHGELRERVMRLEEHAGLPPPPKKGRRSH